MRKLDLLTAGVGMIIVFIILSFFSMKKVSDQTLTPTPAPINQTATDEAELRIEDLQVGTGAEVKSGDTVTVHYTGILQDGTKFDSSLDRNQPFTTQIGVGQVIKGWDQGIVGMKVGGKRRLTIPPSLGYGSTGSADKIPPNATLIFEIELLDVK